MTTQEAIEIARKHAAKDKHQSYTKNAEHPDWKPHFWVVQAILEAANVRR